MYFIQVIFYSLLLFSCNIVDKEENINSYSGKDRVTLVKERPAKIGDILLPQGYLRERIDPSSFAYYLRNLPLDTVDNTIYSYNGSIISKVGYHHSIINIDIGTRDLQQCADAIMRLRAEYLYKTKQYQEIHFNFLSDGNPRFYNNFCRGDRSYKKFRKYLDYIFSYANSSSLRNEMKPVFKTEDMQIGDCFVQNGNPIGHAVIIVDIARHKQTGEKIFLVAQSYMPAQSIHILSNLGNQNITPWYSSNFDETLELPGWTFYKKDLRRFK